MSILWFWVRGSTSSIFNITIGREVGRDNRIFELKDVIKKRGKPRFDDFDSYELKLLKLKNPVDDGHISDIQNFTLQDNEEENNNVALMRDLRKIVDYWPENEAPPDNLIHVIVEVPEQPVVTGVKRASLSIDSLSDLNRIISTDENPVTLVPFITRPQIEEKICGVIGLNLLYMISKPLPRTQDYRGIVISGGSGTGKTRIGFEINNIVKRNEATKGLKDRLNATFEHIYINMNQIKDILGPGLDDVDDNKYPRISEHIDKANKMLTILILTYFFTKAWYRNKIRDAMKLMDCTKGYDYNEVVKLIRREKKLDDTSSTLILVLQIDEFQSGNYWTITLLRVIKSILVQVKYRTLIIPICTGTAPSKIADLGDSVFNITQYGMININLSPMNFEDSMSLFLKFITHNSAILPVENDERFYCCAVNSVRGIPAIIEIAARIFVYMEMDKKNAFLCYDLVQKYWEILKDHVGLKYTKEHWLLSLHGEESIMKLLYYIHVQKLVKKSDDLNGYTTIKAAEASGLIYLEETNKDDIFIPRAPLILIAILVDYFDLKTFFDPILLNPFILINQDNFPNFS